MENASDHGTSIQDSVAEEEDVKQILTKNEITLKFMQENRTFLAINMHDSPQDK